MSTGTRTETVISIRAFSDYLPRVRKIAACLGESAGMSAKEALAAASEVADTCAQIVRARLGSGTAEHVTIALRVDSGSIAAGFALADGTRQWALSHHAR